jgi:hypothetical protein
MRLGQSRNEQIKAEIQDYFSLYHSDDVRRLLGPKTPKHRKSGIEVDPEGRWITSADLEQMPSLKAAQHRYPSENWFKGKPIKYLPPITKLIPTVDREILRAAQLDNWLRTGDPGFYFDGKRQLTDHGMCVLDADYFNSTIGIHLCLDH